MSTLIDLKKMLSEDRDDLSNEDFIDLCAEIVEYVSFKRLEAQSEITQSVEKLSDSFGGGISERELKGE